MNKKVIVTILAISTIIIIILYIILGGIRSKDQITNEDGLIRNALMSPDGSKIVYHVDNSMLYRTNNQRLYVIDVDGENRIELDKNTDILFVPIYITPDNSHLFYRAVSWKANYTQILRVDLNGANKTDIALINQIENIVYCHGLSKLAYSVANWTATENNESSSIWLMDIDGENNIKLINFTYPYYVASLQYNPNNNNLIYSLGDMDALSSSILTGSTSDIAYISHGTYSINTSNQTIVELSDFGYSLEISPQSEMIVLGDNPVVPKDYWTINLVNKNLSVLDLKNKNIITFDFTSEGNKILLNSYPGNGLWIINSDGTDLKQILNDDDFHYFAFFGPDDDKIFYHSAVTVSGNIFVMEYVE